MLKHTRKCVPFDIVERRTFRGRLQYYSTALALYVVELVTMATGNNCSLQFSLIK